MDRKQAAAGEKPEDHSTAAADQRGQASGASAPEESLPERHRKTAQAVLDAATKASDDAKAAGLDVIYFKWQCIGWAAKALLGLLKPARRGHV